jgi:hypothetical protein
MAVRFTTRKLLLLTAAIAYALALFIETRKYIAYVPDASAVPVTLVPAAPASPPSPPSPIEP